MFFKKQKNIDIYIDYNEVERIIGRTKISLLTIDNNYHNLFADGNKSKRLLKLESKLNDLLKEQGKINNDNKKLVKLKKQIMDEIVKKANIKFNNDIDEEEMDEKSEELDHLKTKMEEANERLEQNEDRVTFIPREIQRANKDLFIECAHLCYNKMEDKKTKKDELQEEIMEIRALLKEKILEKQEIENELDNMYGLLHNIAGVDLVNRLDKYFGGKNDQRNRNGYY